MTSLLSILDERFLSLDRRSRKILADLDPGDVFRRPSDKPEASIVPFSCGEYIVRSAAMVERTFGGITRRLWDDPFEWTLPEKLRDAAGILEYLDEVEATRIDAFSFIRTDDDLFRQIPAPAEMRPLIDIMLRCLCEAEHFQGRASALFQVITGRCPAAK